jgi:enoyl-[acyl-carrier protein] reductase I
MSHHLLDGKKGLIFGALNDKSIAWKVAEKAHEEGAKFVLTNAPFAIRLGEIDQLAIKTGSQVVPADATSVEDLNNLLLKSQEILGGKLDFVLHSIGMSPNVRKKMSYDDLDYRYFQQTLDISALSFHKLLQSAKKLDALEDNASVLALSYIAAQRTFYGYNDMAEAKSLLESIVRSFGYIYGRSKGVRVNSISQSPTYTTAGGGVRGFDGLYDYSNRMSPLGNATADECADYCLTLFSDFTKKVTMQNLFHDGGFSSMGMSERVMGFYNKCLDTTLPEEW